MAFIVPPDCIAELEEEIRDIESDESLNPEARALQASLLRDCVDALRAPLRVVR